MTFTFTPVCICMNVCVGVYFHDFRFFHEATFYPTSQSLDFRLSILMKNWLRNYFLAYYLSSSRSVWEGSIEDYKLASMLSCLLNSLVT